MDEVGRGAIAGPVVSAAVILPRGYYPVGLDDSKKLSKSKREDLYAFMEAILHMAVGTGHVLEPCQGQGGWSSSTRRWGSRIFPPN